MPTTILNSTIENNKILLTPINYAYSDDFYEYSLMTRLYDHFEYPPLKSAIDCRVYLDKLITRSKNGDMQYWYIILKDLDKAVGTLCVHSYNANRKSIEIGYGLSPEFWGRGIFHNSCDLLISFLVNKIQIHRIVARTSELNTNSIKSLERLGFLKEGTLRDYYRSYDGRWINAAIFSKILNQ